MAIYKTAINKPITTGLIFVAVIVLGLFSLMRLPIDQMPEMDPPYVTVMTTYAGANASDIETNITKIIENSLNSVDGLKNITSNSRDNISVVTLEFEWGEDIDEALNDIRSYVDLLFDNLPEGVSRPMILKLNSSAMPIMIYGFTAKESYSGLDRILEDNVVNELNRIDGIGNITVSGAPQRYVYIDLDPKQLDAYGISLEQVGNAISANNLDLASGTVKMGKEQYQMRVKGEYVESSEIADIAVTTTMTGKQVFVRDLATVRDTIKDLSLDEKINRHDGGRIIISKQTGANTVQIARQVKSEMDKIMKTMPPDIEATLIRDGSEEIVNAINGLSESIFYALLFVVLVVLVFLGNWRATVIIALTMLPGMMGIFMKEMGWIITIVVCVSTTAAITLIPMLSSKMLKERPFFFKKEDEEAYEYKKEHSFYHRFVGHAFDAIDAAYANLLRWCLRHKRVTLLIALAFFVVTLLPMMSGSIGLDFMKEQDNGQISVSAELQRGTRIEETLKTARHMEDDIYNILGDDVLVVSTTAGSNDDAGFAALFNSTTNNKISMTIRCTKKYDRDETIFQMQEKLRKCFAEYPELVNFQVNQGGMMGGGGNNSLAVEIYGYDFDLTTNFTQELKRRVEQNVPGARDTKVSRDEDRAELKITFDKQKLALHGLNGSTVALYVRNRVNGMAAGFLKEDGEEYNIVVRLREEYRSSISDIEQLSIPTPTGKIIKLEELAKVEEYWCPPTIERKNRQRYLTLTVMPFNTSLQELAQSVQHELDQMEIPSEIHVALAGAYEDQQDSSRDMLMLGLLIMMLVYIVMASQFESFAKPFIIMFSIPFAISGVILMMFFTGNNLDMVGLLGLILLIGIVVKNGIVLVDYINLMRERGISLNEAIAISGQSRLRPVLMTAFTTILGMIPMAASTSEGSEIWTTMGLVVIGGLTVSTFVTLIIVPVLYGVFNRRGDIEKKEKERKKFVFMKIELDNNAQ